MINQVANKGTARLYIAEHYNVEAIYARQLLDLDAFLARVNNALIDKLNEEYYLPQYILIMLDKDMITASKVYDYGVTRTLEDNLIWLLININHNVELHKDDLKKKRAGAIVSETEPRLIWIPMITRPISLEKKVFSLTKKCNKILEDVIKGDKKSHIMRIHVKTSTKNFTRSGDLTPKGFITFWRHVDATMEEFEANKTQLDPKDKEHSYNPQEQDMVSSYSGSRHSHRDTDHYRSTSEKSYNYDYRPSYQNDNNSRYKWYKK